MNPTPFFDYARERYRIFLKKEAGMPRPWTEDKALSQFRFCNIFREDDRNTVWFRENYREANKNHPGVVLATIIFRWFNKIETGEILLKNGLLRNWNSNKAYQLLKDQKVVFTGAYIINSPYGMTKLVGICNMIDKVMSNREELLELAEEMIECPSTQSMKLLHQKLMTFERLGPFMAYEVVTDLRYTSVLDRAADRFTWANPGPGAVRGLCRLNGHPLNYWARENKSHAEILQKGMQELLSESRKPEHWPSTWPQWEMREVEHTLCEFDKYERVHKGEGRMKQTYPPHKGK